MLETLYHRSFGWKPLYGECTTPWVETKLIPILKDLTNKEWKVAGGNLLHASGVIVLSENTIFEDNEIMNTIKKVYPTLSEENVGYKLEKLVKKYKSKYFYEGVWALSVDRIIERGKISGEKFGI